MVRKEKMVRKSIHHWKKMIKWVEKQMPEDRVNYDKMMDEIRELPGARFCSLCMNYLCKECPLAEKYGNCFNKTSKNFYYKTMGSENNKMWAKRAKKLLYQLESLLEKKGGENG